MGEMTDTEKLYNILSNKLTWLTEYGEEVYLLAIFRVYRQGIYP